MSPCFVPAFGPTFGPELVPTRVKTALKWRQSARFLITQAFFRLSRFPDLPMPRFSTPTPYVTFIENKGQTPLQPNGDRPVEVSFCPYFGPE
jgi:hypothetical protein